MKVRFWGVRGSFAMSGLPYLRYGGNTTSVELQTDKGQRLLIDLGTGATEFAKQLMGAEFGKGQGRLPILLSHTHLDHIQGLPFFTPFFIKGNEIRILGANQQLESVLQNQLAPHYSPLNGLENLAAGVSIETIKAELGASGMKDMGRVMAELKARHASALDMSKASALVKAALADCSPLLFNLLRMLLATAILLALHAHALRGLPREAWRTGAAAGHRTSGPSSSAG